MTASPRPERPVVCPVLPRIPHGDSRQVHPALTRLPGPVDRVVLFDELEVWVVTGHAEVRQVLTDDRLVKDWLRLPAGSHPFGGRRYPEDGRAPGVRHLFGLDPPDHTRLRRLTQPLFSARAVARWRPLIETETEQLMNALVHRGHGDLVTEVFEPLSVRVLCKIAGIPATGEPIVREGGRLLFGPLHSEDPAYRKAVDDVKALARQLIDQKRDAPAPATAKDLVSLAATAHLNGTVSLREAIGILFQFIAGNTLNTLSVMAYGALRLIEDPELAGKLRHTPTTAEPLVEELLRLQTPTALTTWRFASCPMSIAGVPIAAGDAVLASLDSANHDTDIYSAPDRLIPGRSGPSHLAFGHGRHHCPGAELARLETAVVLTALAQHIPPLRLATAPHRLPWTQNTFLQGLAEIPVVCPS